VATIPIDVMRDMKNRISDLNAKVRKLQQQANETNVQAQTLHIVAIELENMYDGWRTTFPDSADP
jgi:di/tripeptidase